MENPYESPRMMVEAPAAPAGLPTGTRIDAMVGLAGAITGLMLSPTALDAAEVTWRLAFFSSVAGAVIGSVGSYAMRALAKAIYIS